MNPRQHFIGVEMCAWFYVSRMVEQRGVEVHFIGKLLCLIEHRRTAFSTKAACISGAAFIADRHVAKKLPIAILLPDPRRERRGRCSAAALTMAVTDPVGTSNELEYASSAQTSTSHIRLYLAAHDYSRANDHCGMKGDNRKPHSYVMRFRNRLPRRYVTLRKYASHRGLTMMSRGADMRCSPFSNLRCAVAASTPNFTLTPESSSASQHRRKRSGWTLANLATGRVTSPFKCAVYARIFGWYIGVPRALTLVNKTNRHPGAPASRGFRQLLAQRQGPRARVGGEAARGGSFRVGGPDRH
jgi:hypothetical protein